MPRLRLLATVLTCLALLGAGSAPCPPFQTGIPATLEADHRHPGEWPESAWCHGGPPPPRLAPPCPCGCGERPGTPAGTRLGFAVLRAPGEPPSLPRATASTSPRLSLPDVPLQGPEEVPRSRRG